MAQLEFLIGGYLVVVAMLAGSFLNLAADRLPRKESLVTPRSHCRSCGRVLNALDLVPVAGYLVRRGRCASCGVPIGASSPIVEVACGLAMAAAILAFGLWPGGLAGVAAMCLIGIGLTTYATRRFRSLSPAPGLRPRVSRSGKGSGCGRLTR